MDEFDAIRKYWQPLGNSATPGLIRGIGDDCAELTVPAGHNLLQSMDTLVSGVHFLLDIDPLDLGWRSLAVSASDLAAAGAEPWSAFLGLTLPSLDRDWMAAFAEGVGQCSRAYGLPLVGGDSTRGPLTITFQVQGLCPAGLSLIRSGARAGDLICVSGTLGDAGEALNWLSAEAGATTAASDAVRKVRQRYLRPTPRLSLGMALRGKASACIDISDGLLADLGHILRASGAGASIDLARIPLSASLRTLAGLDALNRALSAGDDYELCFTWPDCAGDPTRLAGKDMAITVIGVIEPEPGLRFTGAPPGWAPPAGSGYRHFS